MKRTYPTDLSDEEWNCLEAHVPALNKRRRPKTYTPLARSSTPSSTSLRTAAPGGSPRDFPPWTAVYCGSGPQSAREQRSAPPTDRLVKWAADRLSYPFILIPACGWPLLPAWAGFRSPLIFRISHLAGS